MNTVYGLNFEIVADHLVGMFVYSSLGANPAIVYKNGRKEYDVRIWRIVHTGANTRLPKQMCAWSNNYIARESVRASAKV